MHNPYRICLYINTALDSNMITDIPEDKPNIQFQNDNSENTNEALRKKRVVTSTLYPLPHKSSTIEQHLMIIKAYIIATNEGKKAVMYKDFKDLVDFHHTYVSSNNKFLEELGLIESESYGKYVPTKKAIEFQRYKKWNQDDKALDILRELVTESWFWNSTKQILLMREDGAGEKEILSKLGADSNADPVKHTMSLKILIKYLEYVGLVKRDDETDKIEMNLEVTPKEPSTSESINNENQLNFSRPSETNEDFLTTKELPLEEKNIQSSEPIHCREEPGNFSLRVKLNELSIQLLEEEIKYIKGKYTLLMKSKTKEDK